MIYTVLKTSTQFNLIYKVQMQITWHGKAACKHINDEGNELSMEEVHI